QGSLTTKLLKFSGANLFVNLESQRGGLQVEVMDEQGKVIDEFSRDKCLPLVGDSTKVMVRWRGGKDLSSLAGKPVRLRFYLTKGSLYSFWVGDSKGASNGYVGAGSNEKV
ncbi:MAG: glycosyl hydrolase family 32, partial [Planctomycetota bacterium]|nr:glycosyl hydrolase family 32 [Planctomycetota bacterium]